MRLTVPDPAEYCDPATVPGEVFRNPAAVEHWYCSESLFHQDSDGHTAPSSSAISCTAAMPSAHA